MKTPKLRTAKKTGSHRINKTELVHVFEPLRCEEDYRRTGNPLFLMVAYRVHRERKLPLPEWILEYFDRVAAGFIKEGESRKSGGKGGTRSAFLIQEIMEMQGDQFNTYAEWRGVRSRAETMFIKLRQADPARSKEDICQEIANKLNENLQPGEKEISDKTIQGWFESL